jgi:hypothetical protein
MSILQVGRFVISGAHLVLNSIDADADADRVLSRDVLRFPFVDAGHDWLIFALPPAELAVYPAETGGGQELFLMCRAPTSATRTSRRRWAQVSASHTATYDAVQFGCQPGERR